MLLHIRTALRATCSLSPCPPLSLNSERWVWPGGLAAVLPSGLPPLSQPQLCGPPRGGGGGVDHGRGDPPELRAEAPGAVPVLDLLLCVHPLRALRRLLERLRLLPAGRATATAPVRSPWCFAATPPAGDAGVRGPCWCCPQGSALGTLLHLNLKLKLTGGSSSHPSSHPSSFHKPLVPSFIRPHTVLLPSSL